MSVTSEYWCFLLMAPSLFENVQYIIIIVKLSILPLHSVTGLAGSSSGSWAEEALR